MTSLRRILRCMQRLGKVSESGSKHLNRSLRYASTQTLIKFVEGENGERICQSPHGDVAYSGMLIQEYVWKNLPNHENRDALVCGVSGRKYTYSQSRDAANYIARSLLNLGLRKGDVVALITPNYPETILAFLGILEAKLIVTTVNPFYTQDETSKQLKSSGAKAIITAAEIASTTLAAARTSVPPKTPIVVIDDGLGSIPDGTIPFKDLIQRGKSLPPLKSDNASQEDLAVLPYSSGTTGMPKGVMLTHKNMVSNMEMTEHSFGESLWKSSSSFQEVIPLILPFFHIYGMNCCTLPRIAQGVQLVTVPKFLPQIFINVLEQYKVTSLFIVPPIVLFLSTSSLVKKSHMKHVHSALSGAAPLSKSDVERFYEKFGLDPEKLRFCQGYGLTESSPVAFMETTGKKYASIGKNVGGSEVRIVDPVTQEDIQSAGQTGELWIRGPHVMKGYYNNEKATKDTITEDGWLKTGDIAYYDEVLDFFITDRLKELIKVKGFQVPPAELEGLLRTHPDVEEAAVIGIPDKRCGEVPKAFILLKKGKSPTEDDIKAFLKGKVSEYKELRGGVTFVDEIPKNPSGKILRMKLKTAHFS